MNVLVWSSYVAQPVGGQERTSLEIALELHRRGHHVVLVGAYDNAPELRAKIPANMPYYFFDFHRPRFKPHWAAGRLLWQLTGKHQTQVVSAHGNVFALFEVCRRRNIPLVWTVHGASPVDVTGIVQRLKKVAMSRVLCHPLSHVVGVSRVTADVTARRFPRLAPERVHAILTGGMDDQQLLRLPAPIPGPPWHLGFIGRLVPQKQPLHLVQIATALRDRLDYRMHVFGDGPLMNVLRTTITHAGLADRFVLHGYWDKGTAGMIEQLHLLVHPAAEEPLGLVLIEAHLGARPVVAYRVGGTTEIVETGKTGFLVPVGDVDALCDGICKVASPAFSHLSSAARESAAARFTIKNMMDQYEGLFIKLSESR